MSKPIYDFKDSINNLIERNAPYPDTLEKYLRCVLYQADKIRKQKLNFNLIYETLEKAFESECFEFEDSWLNYQAPDNSNLKDRYNCFLNTILFQIADLRRMDNTGLLENNYFGIKSPTGNTWYNLNPHTYLECAASGLVANFAIGSFNEKKIGWDVFSLFLELGRFYE